ncbi:MAG: hypothetical protein GY854_25470 [Deltaproteobacteria bacterium]|nr:hypothetical protein [Deltaproteobacteria bacterium]
MNTLEKLAGLLVEERTLVAARNAVRTCLGVTADDRAVLVYDSSTREIAAALVRAFDEIGAALQVFSLDSFGERPQPHPPGTILKALETATVSAMAVTTMRGELSVRRAFLDAITTAEIRHAHMPSITKEVFEDGLAMDYNEVSRFISRLAGIIGDATSIHVTSAGGTDIQINFPSNQQMEKMDGLITKEHWQNLPSGQLIISPANANGVFVVDQAIGDWFEHEYDISQSPVTIDFHRGAVRSISCKNKKFERDLGIFLRSSENSGRISELVIGANLGLTQEHSCSLFRNYLPGASIAVGKLPGAGEEANAWTSSTFLPLTAQTVSLRIESRTIMTDGTFAPDLLD